MIADRGSDMPFQVLLSSVFRVFLILVSHVAMLSLRAAHGREIVTKHIHLQRPLVSVERRPPRMLRIVCLTPTAVLPNHSQILEIEGRGLRIGDIGFARLIDKDAAGRCDPGGPPEIHHPACHVEHMDAHVAHNAIPVFHESAPSARMDQTVVGAHRRRSGPHFVIEVLRRRGVGRIRGRSHVVVAVNLNQCDLAEPARLHVAVARFDNVRRAAALGAHLHDSAILACRGNHGLAFHDVFANRLLNIDIRA